MNNIYLYDGDFSSLLKLVTDLFALKIVPANIKSEKEYIPNLLDEVVHLKLDNSTNLVEKLPKSIVHTAYYIYLSNNLNKELIIYYFLKNAIKYKEEVYAHRNLKCVNEAIKMQKRVSMEAHHLKGFLRFKKMKNNFYYALVNPDNNIIELLANHFKKRLNTDPWLIKDVNRNIYALYDLKKVYYLKEEDIIKLNLDLSSDEEDIENLWITFFQTVAIKERINLRCQMNHMPKKYWKNMLEMEDKL